MDRPIRLYPNDQDSYIAGRIFHFPNGTIMLTQYYIHIRPCLVLCVLITAYLPKHLYTNFVLLFF